MEKKTRKATQKIVVQRNTYTTEHREKARKYYLMGLNLHEISLLLAGCPVRTLERWQLEGKWTGLKQPESLKVRARELHEAGKTYSEIVNLLQVSRATVWRYINEAKAAGDART